MLGNPKISGLLPNSQVHTTNKYTILATKGVKSLMVIQRDTHNPCSPGENHRHCSASAASTVTTTNE